jgi:hypothetical protein
MDNETPPRLLRVTGATCQCPPRQMVGYVTGSGRRVEGVTALRRGYTNCQRERRMGGAVEAGSDGWETLFGAVPDGWAVQKPPVRDRKTGRWQIYAFAQRKACYSTEAWTVDAPAEDLVVYEMARCARDQRGTGSALDTGRTLQFRT